MMTKAIEKAAKQYARPTTQIVAVGLKEAAEALLGYDEAAEATPLLLKEIKQGVRQGFDGFVIACFGDPGLYAARQIATVPVLGIGESAIHMACLLGRRFSILQPSAVDEPVIGGAYLDVLERTGLVSRCCSVRSIGIDVSDLFADLDKTTKALVATGRKAIMEDGAEVLLLGCGGLAGLDQPVEKELGAPVICGVVSAVKFLESLHDYGKKTSKAYTFKSSKVY
jgi:allantoin racemase